MRKSSPEMAKAEARRLDAAVKKDILKLKDVPVKMDAVLDDQPCEIIPHDYDGPNGNGKDLYVQIEKDGIMYIARYPFKGSAGREHTFYEMPKGIA